MVIRLAGGSADSCIARVHERALPTGRGDQRRVIVAAAALRLRPIGDRRGARSRLGQRRARHVLCPGATDTDLTAGIPGVMPASARIASETIAHAVALLLSAPSIALVPDLVLNTRNESWI